MDLPRPPLLPAQVDVAIRMTDEWGISLLNRASGRRGAATSQRRVAHQSRSYDASVQPLTTLGCEF